VVASGELSTSGARGVRGGGAGGAIVTAARLEANTASTPGPKELVK
jgi:hypothetical protein